MYTSVHYVQKQIQDILVWYGLEIQIKNSMFSKYKNLSPVSYPVAE